jgi:hypothetical protein
MASDNGVQSLIKELEALGLTIPVISARLGGRVSERTLYRWRQGESEAQREADVRALTDLRDALSQASAA